MTIYRFQLKLIGLQEPICASLRQWLVVMDNFTFLYWIRASDIARFIFIHILITSHRNGIAQWQKPSTNFNSLFHNRFKQGASGVFGSPGYQSELFTACPLGHHDQIFSAPTPSLVPDIQTGGPCGATKSNYTVLEKGTTLLKWQNKSHYFLCC